MLREKASADGAFHARPSNPVREPGFSIEARATP
jgi:hypothetical protein